MLAENHGKMVVKHQNKYNIFFKGVDNVGNWDLASGDLSLVKLRTPECAPLTPKCVRM